MEEKRKYERFHLQLSGKIMAADSQNGEVLHVVTDDVSAGGAFFRAAKPLAIGTRVKLILTVTSNKLKDLTGAQGVMKAVGTVVRRNTEGIAICFGAQPELVSIQEIYY